MYGPYKEWLIWYRDVFKSFAEGWKMTAETLLLISQEPEQPPFIGHEPLHRTHRSILYQKDPLLYSWFRRDASYARGNMYVVDGKVRKYRNGKCEEITDFAKETIKEDIHYPLTSQHVEDVLVYCMFRNNEIVLRDCIIQGPVHNFGFKRQRVDEKKQEIAEMLACLPLQFKHGYSFLQATVTREGVQWADLHLTIEKLVALGIAAGLVEFTFPKDMWKHLPGGMPYFTVNIK